MPVTFNVTILNGMGVSGEIVGNPIWVGGANGEVLEVAFDFERLLWPWSGYLAITLRVGREDFVGLVEGVVRVKVASDMLGEEGEVVGGEEEGEVVQMIELPIRVEVIEKPPREKRVLWDQYHSLRYPSGYFPRDALWVQNEPFDWNADHLHTNFKGVV